MNKRYLRRVTLIYRAKSSMVQTRGQQSADKGQDMKGKCNGLEQSEEQLVSTGSP